MVKSFHLFERFGVELEYMIVDAGSLNIRPIADKLVHAIGRERKNEVRHGNVRWSNELVLHVIELKTDGPVRQLQGLDKVFQEEVRYLNDMLAEHGSCLLPGGMHPWMDPLTETRLWPHGDREIYDAFNRIFNCKGHGWSNLQSTHLNLPFSGDEEFRRLHSAIRILMPLLPALAASSPFIEGHRAPALDMRLEAYRHNCAIIPSVSGRVVPERVRSQKEYQEAILGRIYTDLAPYDPEEVLREEWVNARGTIARFTRGTIELRVLDNQECPRADLAILRFVVEVIRAFVAEKVTPLATQEAVTIPDLEDVFLKTVARADDVLIDSPAYREALGLSVRKACTVGEALDSLLDRVSSGNTAWADDIRFILRHGCLARRLRRAVGRTPTREGMRKTYEELAAHLQHGSFFGS